MAFNFAAVSTIAQEKSKQTKKQTKTHLFTVSEQTETKFIRSEAHSKWIGINHTEANMNEGKMFKGLKDK